MRLNEAIDKTLLSKIMPFNKWKEIQSDPKARRHYEREQEQRRKKEKEEQLASKYASMTAQDFRNIWIQEDYDENKEMFKRAHIEEKQLEDWSTDVPSHLARMLIDYLGGRELSKGNFGNRAIARMAKSRTNHPEIQQLARSVQQSRSNYRRRNKSLNETIDKSLLKKIPNFDDWRDGGGSMAGYYRKKLKQKYPQGYIVPNLKEEDYRWALDQKRDRTTNRWTEEKAKRMSEIIHKIRFIYRHEIYHHPNDDSAYPEVDESGFRNGKHYNDSNYRSGY